MCSLHAIIVKKERVSREIEFLVICDDEDFRVKNQLLTDENFSRVRERERERGTPNKPTKKEKFLPQNVIQEKKRKSCACTQHIIKKQFSRITNTRARARERERERLNEPGETVGIAFYFARKNIEFKREHKSSTHF